MKISCCYRCIPNGEVIHTYIDSETHMADLMPISLLDTRDLELAEYAPAQYVDRDINWMAMCEAILLSNKDYALVLESGTIGYFVLCWDGYWKFMETPMDEREKGRQSVIPQPGNFTYIGYRRTKLIQFRSCPGIYRLTYDRTNNTIVTNDGILTPMFNVSELSNIDYHYAGYKEMLNNGAYAVVYLNGQPKFLRKTDDDKLVIL